MQTVPIGAGGAIPRPLFYLGEAPARLAVAGILTVALMLPAAGSRAEDEGPLATTGHASWYGHEFARRPTASGERFDPEKLTAAHRTLPLGTRLRVTNLRNGRSVLVTINDRGPYMRRREIDLSLGAARAIGIIRRGVERVRLELVES
jgi:rare lipoprotein A